MQEMGLLLQEENEPKQEKNQQAPGLPCVCRQRGGWRLSPPLDTAPGRHVLPGWGRGGAGNSGRRKALDAFPALYGEKMIAEQPWPSALGEMGLAYRCLPGGAVNWGQEPGLLAQRSPLGASVGLGNAADPKCWAHPSDHPGSSAGSGSGLSLVPLPRPYSRLPFAPNLSAVCPRPAHSIQWPSLVCLQSRSLTSWEVDIRSGVSRPSNCCCQDFNPFACYSRCPHLFVGPRNLSSMCRHMLLPSPEAASLPVYTCFKVSA